MHPNELLIHHFYTCFQLKDFKGMQDCYADDAYFSDEVFTNLDGRQVRAMWEMLIKRGKDLQILHTDVTANDEEGSANWVAHYSFGDAGRPVENKIRAKFRFAHGKIIGHKDQFDFYSWSRQALGIPGWLLGWSGYLQKKVQVKAMQGLDAFLLKNKTT